MLTRTHIHTEINSQRQPIQQQGSALIVSLLILLVMTVIGVTTMNSSMMEEKMATNNNDMVATFQAAEAAIGAGISDAKDPDAKFFMDAKDAYMKTCNEDPTATIPVNNYPLDTTTNARATLTVKNMAHHINSSMGIFTGYNVEFDGAGTLTVSNAKAVNLQGALKGPYPFNENDPCLNKKSGGTAP